MTDDALRSTLRAAQQLGFLGDRPIDEVIAHARLFVRALELAPDEEATVIDLGAGGGVPGLVIASDRPGVRLTMVDRRTKRTDFLERMVRRHGWAGRVTVVSGDARRLADGTGDRFDAAVARGFGPPDETLELAARFVRPGGRIVVSEPPSGDRWDPALIARLALTRDERSSAAGRVVVFTR
jgi:16S rRNA (guanine527-N7)-methyltransferase